MSEESWFVQNLHLILELLIAIIGLITAIIGGKTLYKKYKSKKIASITESPLANIQQVERAETVVGPQINIQVSDVEGVAAIKEIFSNKRSLVRASVGRLTVPKKKSAPMKVNIQALTQEVKDKVLTDAPLTPLIAKCLDIARTLDRKEDVSWIERELYGCPEWYSVSEKIESKDMSDKSVFPDYRRVKAKVYISFRNYSGLPLRDITLQPRMFVGFPVHRIEQVVRGTGRDTLIVMRSPAPEEYSEVFDKLGVKVEEDVPFVINAEDLRRLLSELRLRTHRFVTNVSELFS